MPAARAKQTIRHFFGSEKESVLVDSYVVPHK